MQPIDRLRRQLASTDEKKTWALVSGGAAALAGLAARRVAVAGWRRVRHQEPPRHPQATSTSWAEAIAWTALVAAAVGVARLVARRGATAGWKRVTGHTPPARA
jgi:hypothetical protein